MEERVPELDGAVRSAVEVAETQAPDEARSALLTRGLFDDAARRLTRLPSVVRLEHTTTWRALAVSALVVASGAGATAVGPPGVGPAGGVAPVPSQRRPRSCTAGGPPSDSCRWSTTAS